jgi:hypothetical protein
LSKAQHHSTRKRAAFPCGSCITRDLGESTQETKQLTAGVTPAGAVSRNEVDGHAINLQKAHTLVRRLQARIVKVTSGVNRGETASAPGRGQGLSGIQGNLPVSF